MLKKAILIVTAATFAPTSSFAGPFVYYECFDPNTLYKDVVDNAFFGQYFEIAEYGESNFTIVAGSAEAETPLDGLDVEGPKNGTKGLLMYVYEGDEPCN